jgi:hypothetical protein
LCSSFWTRARQSTFLSKLSFVRLANTIHIYIYIIANTIHIYIYLYIYGVYTYYTVYIHNIRCIYIIYGVYMVLLAGEINKYTVIYGVYYTVFLAWEITKCTVIYNVHLRFWSTLLVWHHFSAQEAPDSACVCFACSLCVRHTSD